jgi:pilus assembly protein CpaE
VGRTLVAVSLALTLRQLTGESVVLMDADFLFGDADLHLKLTTERSVLDLLPHIEALDSKMVNQVVGKYPNGVHLLARPPRPEQADAIKDGDVRSGDTADLSAAKCRRATHAGHKPRAEFP